MTELLTGLASDDYLAVGKRIAAFGDSADATEETLLAALTVIPAIRATFVAASSVDAPDGPIIWHEYEHLIWALGESFRRILKQSRRLRKSESLWVAIETLACDQRLGKGRESWVMLLGQYGGLGRVPTVMRLLGDDGVQGHALHAMRHIGSPEGIELAQLLVEHPRPWIRAEAKKYLLKVGALVRHHT